MVPGRPLHIGSGRLQLTSGIPLVPFPLQSGAFLLVQLVSGTSASAPVQVGRSPSFVVICAALSWTPSIFLGSVVIYKALAEAAKSAAMMKVLIFIIE